MFDRRYDTIIVGKGAGGVAVPLRISPIPSDLDATEGVPVRRVIQALLGRLRMGSLQPAGRLGGFFDSLLQTFENRRPALSDEIIRGGAEAVEQYFVEVYQKERGRLREAVTIHEGHYSKEVRAELEREVDDLVRRVIIPLYVRLAAPFTSRERNGFYLIREPYHGVERTLWAVTGMALGGFVVWAPFIPLWSKEWTLVFMIGGLLFPELRRYVMMRRYEAELNRVVARADREVDRYEMVYLTVAGGIAAPEDSDLAGDERESQPEEIQGERPNKKSKSLTERSS